MAKKSGKKSGAKSSAKRPKRRNPSNPKRHVRRRRNPSGGFGDRVMKLAIGGAVLLGTGAATYVAMSKFQPGQPMSKYGIPLVGVLAGAGLARKYPMVGTAVGLGALTPFVLPVASKALTAISPPATTAAGLGRAMRAVQLGAVGVPRMPPMGAVGVPRMPPMGAVHY